MDERDAYKLNGVIYDAEGTRIGTAGEVSFVPKRGGPATVPQTIPKMDRGAVKGVVAGTAKEGEISA